MFEKTEIICPIATGQDLLKNREKIQSQREWSTGQFMLNVEKKKQKTNKPKKQKNKNEKTKQNKTKTKTKTQSNFQYKIMIKTWRIEFVFSRT